MQSHEGPTATSFMPVSSKHEALVYQHHPVDPAAAPLAPEADERRAGRPAVKCQPWVAQPGARRDRWV